MSAEDWNKLEDWVKGFDPYMDKRLVADARRGDVTLPVTRLKGRGFAFRKD